MTTVYTVHPKRQTVIDRAIETDHVITYEDVEKSTLLRAVAINYVMDQEMHHGENYNTFLLSLYDQFLNKGTLTAKQCAAALRTMIDRAKKQRDYVPEIVFPAVDLPLDKPSFMDLRSRKTKQIDDSATALPELIVIDQNTVAVENFSALQAAAFDQILRESATTGQIAKLQTDQKIAATKTITPLIPNGYYTVILGEQTRYTFRLTDVPKHFKRAPGTQMVSYLSGADNESSYTGCAFLAAGMISFWQSAMTPGCTKIREAGYKLVAQPISAARAYVLESKRCFICGRLLTTPESILDGIGPVCKAKNAWFAFSLDPQIQPTHHFVPATPKTTEEIAIIVSQAEDLFA